MDPYFIQMSNFILQSAKISLLTFIFTILLQKNNVYSILRSLIRCSRIRRCQPDPVTSLVIPVSAQGRIIAKL